jgi:hypothetical protein
MTRLIGVAVAVAVAAGPAGAQDKDAAAVLGKAIQALGGEEKLGKAAGLTWTSRGTLTFMGTDNPIETRVTVRGIDHYRQEFEGEFGGTSVAGVMVLAGDKGWRKFGDDTAALGKDEVANQKRQTYLAVVPVTVVPLKGKGFKAAAAGEEKVDGKPAARLKVTGPDGKDFTLSFDKETGLPVKLVAEVVGFMGDEYTQETTFSDYKEMGGIKKATKIVSKRNGEKFIDQQVTAFKVLDKIDPKAFDEPK